MKRKVLQWLLGNDTGLSSKAIVAHMEGISDVRMDYPHDTSDLGRCIRLLQLNPSYRKRLPEMAQVSGEWGLLVEHWEELEAIYSDTRQGEDAAVVDAYNRLYRLLRSIIGT